MKSRDYPEDNRPQGYQTQAVRLGVILPKLLKDLRPGKVKARQQGRKMTHDKLSEQEKKIRRQKAKQLRNRHGFNRWTNAPEEAITDFFKFLRDKAKPANGRHHA